MINILDIAKNLAVIQVDKGASKTIATQEELVKAVASWAEKQNRLNGIQQEYKERINALTEEFAKKCELDMMFCDVLEKLIVEYCSAHKDELLAKVEGKSVDFGVAQVVYRKRKPRLEVDDEDDLIKQLEERQLHGYLKVTKKVDLAALQRGWGVLSDVINGVKLIKNEESITLST